MPVALAAVWLLSALGLRLAYEDRVLPGTRVGDIEAGGTDARQLDTRLREVQPANRTVLVEGAGQRFRITGAQVAFRIDRRRTVERALAAGRRGVFDAVTVPVFALGRERVVRPAYAMDDTTLKRVVAAISRRVDARPFNGALEISADSLTARTRPARPGRTVNQQALRRALSQALRRGGGRLTIPVRERPGPTRQAVERVANEASAYLQEAPLRLTGAGRAIELSRRAVAPLLAVEAVPESSPPAVRLGVDASTATALIERIAKRRDREPSDARIEAAAAPVLFETQGAASWRPRPADIGVEPAKAGREVRRDAALNALAAAVRAKRHEVKLPVRRIPPRVGTDDLERVGDLVGTFTTRYACCQPRATNIRLIADAVDGAVVQPGERFSLNDVAGPRTRERGFLPAPFIADGKLVDSVGGGVSQFSTTMYNAAYFGGLQLDAHQPHSFYIERYPAGREATLDYPSIDMTWTNDTQAPVVVRATTTETSVTVSLYGDNGGRRVRSEVGRRSTVEGRDFTITVTRIVRHPDGQVAKQPSTTTYDQPPP